MKYALLDDPAGSLAPLPYLAAGPALVLVRDEPVLPLSDIVEVAAILATGGRAVFVWQSLVVDVSASSPETPAHTRHDAFQWSKRIGAALVRVSFTIESFAPPESRELRRPPTQVGRGSSGLVSARAPAAIVAAPLCHWSDVTPATAEESRARRRPFFELIGDQVDAGVRHALSLVDSNATLHWLIPLDQDDAPAVEAVAAASLPRAEARDLERLVRSVGVHYAVGVSDA